jgi:putative autoinducer-2 (AI-2) aldolase
MADLDDIKDGKDWGLDTPAKNDAFFLKGSEGLD